MGSGASCELVYRDDSFDDGLVDAHLGSFESPDVDSDPRDQHELDPLAHLISGVDAYEPVQPVVVFKQNEQIKHEYLVYRWLVVKSVFFSIILTLEICCSFTCINKD